MQYFLAKTEPDVYSIQDLQRDGWSVWNGVRNPQAVNFIKTMEIGDRVIIYNSSGQSAIVGLAEVIVAPEPDPKDKKSWTVGLKYLQTFKNPVKLHEIKATKKFEDFKLVYHPRLSTMSVPEEFVEWLRKERKLKI